MANDELNWSELAHRLPLQGIPRQLVLNSIVAKKEQDSIELHLLDDYEMLLKPEAEGQIKQALEQHLGLSLQLKFKVKPSLPVETPAQARQRELELERQDVIEKIKQQPVVKVLKDKLDFELVEESVVKIDATEQTNEVKQ